MSEKKKFPWGALPWALIALGLCIGGFGFKGLFSEPGTGNLLIVGLALVVAAGVILVFPKKNVATLSVVCAIIAVNLVFGSGEGPPQFSDVFTGNLWALGLLLVAYSSVVVTGKSLLSPQTAYVFVVNAAAAIGIIYALASFDAIVQAPLGVAAFLLGIVFAFALRGKKTAPAPEGEVE